MHGPDPATRHPIPGAPRTGFLKNFITRPNILVGDYTYYDDPAGPERFEQNVLYHFDFIGDRLVIGRFCSLAAECRFIMNGGNHPTDWLTTYPFPVFGHGWEAAMPERWPHRGDTVVGGNPATLLRYRFEEADRARLLALRWWDWDAAKITRNVKALCSGDIAALEEAE